MLTCYIQSMFGKMSTECVPGHCTDTVGLGSSKVMNYLFLLISYGLYSFPDIFMKFLHCNLLLDYSLFETLFPERSKT